MKKIINWTSTALATATATLTPLLVKAQTFEQAPAFPPLEPAQGANFMVILQKIAGFMLGLAGGIAVIYLIWAGIQYITGGAKGAAAAKDAIVNAIIGIVVIILAYVIVRVVINVVSS